MKAKRCTPIHISGTNSVLLGMKIREPGLKIAEWLPAA
jgi:hypothetical protein